MTDAVITYVNGNDPEWQADYFEALRYAQKKQPGTTGGRPSRWRDFGTLPLLVKNIRLYMPWIRNIYIIVSGESQNPHLEHLGVTVIHHNQIIPQELLPTFNSTCIELFMYRIPGLSEQFIYFNDDMFPIASLEETDFFEEGKPKILVKQPSKAHYNMYTFHLRNGYNIAASVLKKRSLSGEPPRFGHTANPMLKSTWELLWEHKPMELMASCTKFRTIMNINQDVVNYYHYINASYIPSKRRTMYTTVMKLDSAYCLLQNTNIQVLCINDTGVDDIEKAKTRMHRLLLGKNPTGTDIVHKSDCDSSN